MRTQTKKGGKKGDAPAQQFVMKSEKMTVDAFIKKVLAEVANFE
jgi:hypothetical protein